MTIDSILRVTSAAQLVIFGSLLTLWTAQAQSPPGVGQNAKISSDFQNRAAKYLAMRKKVAGKSPKPTSSPEEIAANQKKLSERIRTERKGAAQGELFAPEIARYFRQQIAATLAGAHGDEIRASLRRAEPVNLKLQVNQAYPENVPLQSTPPTLLLNLPEPPDGLEYRIVGRDLILRDVEANTIVDFIPDAIPL